MVKFGQTVSEATKQAVNVAVDVSRGETNERGLKCERMSFIYSGIVCVCIIFIRRRVPCLLNIFFVLFFLSFKNLFFVDSIGFFRKFLYLFRSDKF